MSKLKIAAVPIELLDHIFPKCIVHLEKVIKKAPDDLCIEGIKKDLYNGDSLLVIVSDMSEVVAVNVCTATTYDTGHKVMFIPITGGERMEEWLDDFMNIAQALAKDFQCHEIRGMACRKGWLKVLEKHNWYPIHTVIGCKVNYEEETE